MMEFVSWDDYSQYMESHIIHVPNHQPVYVVDSIPQAPKLSMQSENCWRIVAMEAMDPFSGRIHLWFLLQGVAPVR